jgi:hypothetical protein
MIAGGILAHVIEHFILQSEFKTIITINLHILQNCSNINGIVFECRSALWYNSPVYCCTHRLGSPVTKPIVYLKTVKIIFG